MAVRVVEILDGVNPVVAGMEGWSPAGPSEAELADGFTQLRTAAAKTMAVSDAIASTKGVVDSLTATATENNVTYAVRPPREMGRVTTIGTGDGQEKPLITLEAVRMALRRIDQGEIASQSAGKGRDLTDGRQRADSSVTSGPCARSGLSRRNPDLKCWICDGSHFYYENPNCKKIHEERRSQKQNGGPVRPKDGHKGRKESPKKFSESSLSSVRWAEPP